MIDSHITQMISVKEEYRYYEISTILMEKAFANIRKKEHMKVISSTEGDNSSPSLSFRTKLSFTSVGGLILRPS
jgi:hypothetical protein